MTQRCKITGKNVMMGNNVSHAKNKTRKRFLPNLQKISFLSTTLNFSIQLRVSTRAIRIIEHNGGLDLFISSLPHKNLSKKILKLKKIIKKHNTKLINN